MADPRELARQAFSLLQSALASSEARAEKLTEELARQPVSKDALSNKLGVLSHRLESVEQECERWKREAEQLEDVLANERVKFEALKNKLEIAESGPDKLSKKEVNYWRGNAEKFDEQINAYKARIAALRRELREKDQLLESKTGAGPSAAGEASYDTDALVAAEAEIAGLRQQIASLNAALADAHSTRGRLESDVAALRDRLDATDQQAGGPESVDNALAADLERLRTENTELRSSVQLSEAGLHALRRARDDLANELAELKRQAESERAKDNELERQLQLSTTQLEEARTREATLKTELDATREALAEREHRLPAGAVSGAVADELKAELGRAQQESAELRASLESAAAELAELRDTREGLAAELAEAQRRLENTQAHHEEQDHAQRKLTDELEATRQREAALRGELDETRRSSEGNNETTQALQSAIASAEQRAAKAEEQLAELTAELKEEKEYSENLSELANGRQDQVNKLEDAVDEARERLEDALWRLEKTKHFERLVARRKGLIASLIETIKAKNKAMTALKAGIDSLRTHKAMIEETQQKLLIRMETLKKELGAAKGKIKILEADAATVKQKGPNVDEGEVAALEERLATQAELIQSLESEIKAVKTYKREADERGEEIAQLHEELETKNTIITRLQSDLDEQQRKLAKLRGSDSETLRLKAVTEQDKSKIDILERENAELRAMIESADRPQREAEPFTDEREVELKAKIAELTEALNKWKKKYEFLATEAPAAYQTQTAAKQ